MAKAIDAIYQGGVIRPVEPLDLDEGERVRVRIARLREDKLARRERKLAVLGGLWAGKGEVTEEDIKDAKRIWNRGLEKHLRIVSEDD